MRAKYLVGGGAAVVLLVAAAAGYVAYYQGFGQEAGTSAHAVVKDRAKTVSNREGRLVIAYAGDLAGILGPCG
jgi:hypothetical protein